MKYLIIKSFNSYWNYHNKFNTIWIITKKDENDVIFNLNLNNYENYFLHFINLSTFEQQTSIYVINKFPFISKHVMNKINSEWYKITRKWTKRLVYLIFWKWIEY